MSYNDKKFLDQDGLVTLLKKLDNYPTNEILGTVVNAIQMSLGGKVGDVQVNGTSIVDGGIANIPIATHETAGLVKINGNGLTIVNDIVRIVPASNSAIQTASNTTGPITPGKQHLSVFYGLAKAAGDTTQAQSDNAVGTYTDEAKTAIRTMLGVATPADIPTNVSAFTNDAGYLTQHQSLDNYVQKTDYASANNAGIVKVKPENGISIYDNFLWLPSPTNTEIKEGSNSTKSLKAVHQDVIAFYGLAKAAGDATQSSSNNAVGTYTTEAKAAIRSMIDAGTPLDVQLDNTSVVSNGIATIPIANFPPNAGTDAGNYGVIRIKRNRGLSMNSNDGSIFISYPTQNQCKAGNDSFLPVTTAYQHYSIFYGLSKAAGVDLKNETVTFNTYPDASKAAIQNMLGISDLIASQEQGTATAAHAVGTLFLMNGKLHRVTNAIVIGDAVVEGQNCEVVKADEVFIKNTDYADAGKPCIVQLYSVYGITKSGGFPTTLQIAPAISTDIKKGNVQYKPIVSNTQHEAVFYGLSKAAGVDLKDETVTFGTYPETSKTAIRTMIGAVGPTDYANQTTGGVVKIIASGGGGFQIDQGYLLISPAVSRDIKSGTNTTLCPIIPGSQHASTFYGLAKAAGDTTQASSENAVGTYTASAKSAIQTMLGITDALASKLDAAEAGLRVVRLI